MSTILQRKRNDLADKAEGLKREFKHWRDQSEEGKSYQKHHTQIRRITARLEGMLTTVAADLDKLKDDELLTHSAQVEEKLLAVHLVWEFFRSRLAMRLDDRLRPYLQACDEFAWACYEEARAHFLATLQNTNPAGAAVQVKEPPLVFLNGGWSPFAVARDRAFELDRPGFKVDTAAVAWLQNTEFSAFVKSLPFPMVGVPWYQVSHLPDALVIGHEMGHVLEWDFGLGPAADAALAKAAVANARRAAWRSWRLEVFADVCGCLAGGPRFGGALMDFLAGDVAKIRREVKTEGFWGSYPPRWLRLELVAATLDRIGFGAHAMALLKDWRLLYGEPARQSDFRKDSSAVIEALMTGPYDSLRGAAVLGPALTEVLSYRSDAGDKSIPLDESFVEAIRNSGAAGSANPRELFAAVRLLYEEDPAGFVEQDYSRRVCEMVVRNTASGTRGTPAENLDRVAAAETTLGQTWFR